MSKCLDPCCPRSSAPGTTLQLLEESRVMHVREVLLRLDQANKGMLDCLLGSGGPVETLSASLSRVDSLEDARDLIGYIQTRAGLPTLPGIGGHPRAAPEMALNDGASKSHNEEVILVKEPCSGDGAVEEPNICPHRAQMTSGLEILDLAEDGLERAFEGARDGTDEAARMAHEMCSCIAEVRCMVATFLVRLPLGMTAV